MTPRLEAEAVGLRTIWRAAKGAAFATTFALVVTAAQAQTGRSPDSGTPGAGDSLSDRLDKSNGVIVPREGVDPGIQKPPPPVHAPTPIVPPPGSRSGDAIAPK